MAEATESQGRTGRATADALRMGRALGWLSVGLGIAEVAAPKTLGRLIGVERPWTLRALGLRGLATGAAILTRPREPGYLWLRVAGDAMDLSMLGAARRTRDSHRVRTTAALGVVGVITAVDVMASRRAAVTLLGQEAAPVEISLSVAVDRPADDLYRYWRNLNNLPRFMSSLRSVRPLDDGPAEQVRRWQWSAGAAVGPTLVWTSELRWFRRAMPRTRRDQKRRQWAR